MCVFVLNMHVCMCARVRVCVDTGMHAKIHIYVSFSQGPCFKDSALQVVGWGKTRDK